MRATDGSAAVARLRAPSQCNLQASVSSGIIQVGSFGFNVPSNATIRGIVVTARVRGNTSSGWTLETMQLTTGNTTSSNRTGSLDVDHRSYTNEGWGSRGDTWGRSWTPAQVNSDSFTVRMAVRNNVSCGSSSAEILYLDSIRAQILYDVPCN